MLIKVCVKAAACFILVLAVSDQARAQFRNSIEGTIADPSGAIIPEAQVALANLETGVSQTTQSNSAGYYHFSSLPPGRYKITASAKGFKSVTQESIALGGSEVLTVPLVLQVGQVTEQVSITGEVTPIQKSESKVASNITAYEVRNFPLPGRNVLDLVALTLDPSDTDSGFHSVRVSSPILCPLHDLRPCCTSNCVHFMPIQTLMVLKLR